MMIMHKLNPLFSCKFSIDNNHINCPKLRDSDQCTYYDEDGIHEIKSIKATSDPKNGRSDE